MTMMYLLATRVAEMIFEAMKRHPDLYRVWIAADDARRYALERGL